jgi:hypothetical protein
MGNCNSSQLVSILEEIGPSIIFEELTVENYDESYTKQKLITLETNAIKEYKIGNKVEHKPVDTYPRTREYDEKIEQLYLRIEKAITQEAFHFRTILEQLESKVANKGFDFLNSSDNDQILDEIDGLKMKILEHLNNKRLFEIHSEEIEMNNNRENEILKNIYRFAQDTPFDKGVMFIGSGHRRTIIPLIEKFQEKEETKITWKYYPKKFNKYFGA